MEQFQVRTTSLATTLFNSASAVLGTERMMPTSAYKMGCATTLLGTITGENPARIQRGHLKLVPRSVDLDVSHILVRVNSLRAEGKANQDMSMFFSPRPQQPIDG